MEEVNVSSTERISGKVKVFYGNKGYGFFEYDGNQLFFHVNQMIKRKRRIRKGDNASFVVIETESGIQAGEILFEDAGSETETNEINEAEINEIETYADTVTETAEKENDTPEENGIITAADEKVTAAKTKKAKAAKKSRSKKEKTAAKEIKEKETKDKETEVKAEEKTEEKTENKTEGSQKKTASKEKKSAAKSAEKKKAEKKADANKDSATVQSKEQPKKNNVNDQEKRPSSQGRSKADSRQKKDEGERGVDYQLGWLGEGYLAVKKDCVGKYSLGQAKNILLAHPAFPEPQEIDEIVISTKGIFVIETKRFSGELTINKNGNWIFSNGKNRQSLTGPVAQALRHHILLQTILKGVVPEKYIYDIICIAKGDVIIEGEENCPIPVMKVDMLNYRILTAEGKAENDLDIKMIEEKINESKVVWDPSSNSYVKMSEMKKQKSEEVAKKTAAKKTTEKTEDKTTADKKPAVKKTADKKTAAKKKTAKKTTANKTATNKTATKKTTTKKTAVKKISDKTAAKKTVTKTPAAKKTAAGKSDSKKSAVKKSDVKKSDIKKTAIKKTAVKKTAAKSTVGGKASANKTAAKKTAVKKTSVKKK